jgi:hypothetical protein
MIQNVAVGGDGAYYKSGQMKETDTFVGDLAKILIFFTSPSKITTGSLARASPGDKNILILVSIVSWISPQIDASLYQQLNPKVTESVVVAARKRSNSKSKRFYRSCMSFTTIPCSSRHFLRTNPRPVDI